MGRPLLCKDEWIPLLGTASDQVLAKRWGVSTSAVSLWRGRHKVAAWGSTRPYPRAQNRVGPFQCPDHVVPRLGTVADPAIAEECGVSNPIARRWRVERGIGPFRRHHRKQASVPREWDALVGTMPDRTLALKLGISKSKVYVRRRKLGIPAYTVTNPKGEVRRLRARVAALEAENAELRAELVNARANEYKGGCPEDAM